MNRQFKARLVIGLGLAFSAMPVQGNVFSQLSLNAGTEANVPRGLDSAHEIDSEFVQLGFSGGKFFQLGLNDSLTVSGAFTASKYNSTSGFDGFNLSMQAEYGHKFGFGAYAPRLAFAIGAARDFREGRARDNRNTSAQLRFSKRFTPALSFSMGVDYADNQSPTLTDDPAVLEFGYDPDLRLPFELFDYHSQAVFVAGEYSFENGWLVEAGFRRINGGTVSSTTTPSLGLYKRARAFYSDPGFDSDWFAYLLDANTNEWSAGLSLPVGIDSSVNVRATWHDSAAPVGGSYENAIYTIGFVRNF